MPHKTGDRDFTTLAEQLTGIRNESARDAAITPTTFTDNTRFLPTNIDNISSRRDLIPATGELTGGGVSDFFNPINQTDLLPLVVDLPEFQPFIEFSQNISSLVDKIKQRQIELSSTIQPQPALGELGGELTGFGKTPSTPINANTPFLPQTIADIIGTAQPTATKPQPTISTQLDTFRRGTRTPITSILTTTGLQPEISEQLLNFKRGTRAPSSTRRFL